MSRRIPRAGCLEHHFLALARMVAETSWLPNPSVVRVGSGAVFPTLRNMRRRFQTFDNDLGEVAGMFDDNHTPKWAFLWSHGIPGGSREGWTFAHVWPCSTDITGYTHVANMVMLPECFGSLTDKRGPLTGFLRWHAWNAYGWKPASAAEPQKPSGYDEIVWRYLDQFERPKEYIRERVTELRNQRVQVLRPIMERLGTL